MVDLVKIRRKAKKEREVKEAAPPAAPADVAAAGGAEPVTGEAAAAQPAPGAGKEAAEPREMPERRPARSRSGQVPPPPPYSAEPPASGITPPHPAEPQAFDGTPAAPSLAPGEGAAAAAPAAPSKLERFKEQAGRRRDGGVIAAQAEEAQADGQLELLTFLLGKEQCAVDIERIVEIVTPRPVTRIPNSDASVVGIISLRGTIVTLVDVRGKLRHRAEATEDAETRVVVIDYGNETVGFTVDRVLRVVKITPQEIEPHPVVHNSELDEAIRGVFRVSGALTILLDLDKLVGEKPLSH